MRLEKYKKIVKNNEKKEKYLRNSLLAFLGGGTLGVIAQSLIDLYYNVLNFKKDESFALMSITIVFITSILTLFGVYKKVGKIFGAGLFVPTTGFANSLTSASIEGRYEGFILGVGSKAFSLAGSVIFYGISFSIIFLIISQILIFFGVNI